MEDQLLEIAQKSIWSKNQVKAHIDKVFEYANEAPDRDAFIRQFMEDAWTSATRHHAVEKCYRALTGGLTGETANKIREALKAGYEGKGWE